MIEDEDADPVGAPPAHPLQTYADLAVKHGLIRAGDKLDQSMVEFAAELVNLCARIGDGYGDGEAGGNAGEHIRAEYLA